MLVGLVSLLSTHPKIQQVVRAYSSVSLLGRPGRNMYVDRLLEYVNLLQQKRMNAFTGFDSALHHTPLLRAMLHVDHAYCEAAHGAAPTDAPMTHSMLFQARILQDMFLRELGRDLTVDCNNNPFWPGCMCMRLHCRVKNAHGLPIPPTRVPHAFRWTGRAQDMYNGDFRFKRPWEWWGRVAQGLSGGVGAQGIAPREEWEAYVRHFIKHGLWDRPTPDSE